MLLSAIQLWKAPHHRIYKKRAIITPVIWCWLRLDLPELASTKLSTMQWRILLLHVTLNQMHLRLESILWETSILSMQGTSLVALTINRLNTKWSQRSKSFSLRFYLTLFTVETIWPDHARICGKFNVQLENTLRKCFAYSSINTNALMKVPVHAKTSKEKESRFVFMIVCSNIAAKVENI